ncbi:Glycosyl hydrolase superfamily protein [Perilla frutescens var. hirtella]|nr:Glycosyl hydrolase superfamily protein [Perilla frutescens var. hirtella]
MAQIADFSVAHVFSSKSTGSVDLASNTKHTIDQGRQFDLNTKHKTGSAHIGEVESLGINYGQVGNNLPPPERALDLLHALWLTKARIYDTNPQILAAFANSNVELIVTVENEMISTLMDPNQALQWVMTCIKPYVPATKITGITVGNEIFTGSDTTLISYLVPAMVIIHAALVRFELNRFIHVLTPSSLAVLQESYPPSTGSFRPELSRFLAATKAPFWINAYPYFTYQSNPDRIPLEYVLFDPNPGVLDPYMKLHYDNMLYAQVDAVIFAMVKRAGPREGI